MSLIKKHVGSVAVEYIVILVVLMTLFFNLDLFLSPIKKHHAQYSSALSIPY